jgi:hypothetical protein
MINTDFMLSNVINSKLRTINKKEWLLQAPKNIGRKPLKEHKIRI